jgi:RHS repeat-associated protein
MGWKGRFGVYTDAEAGLMLMGVRYHAPCIGRFISRDPVGFDGGINLCGYCGGDPVGYVDPLGLTGYWHQAWEFFKGELSCFDPISLAKGIYECDRHILECWIRDRHPLRAYADIAAGAWDGLQFWNKATPYESGKSFMSCVLLAAPALKKIPSFNPAGAAARPMAAAAELGAAANCRLTLYRAGSEAEWADILAHGGYRSTGSGAYELGKWFAFTQEHAEAWGTAMRRLGARSEPFCVFRAEFPADMLGLQDVRSMLDGIGPAALIRTEDLPRFGPITRVR